jgi:hypothetical protein
MIASPKHGHMSVESLNRQTPTRNVVALRRFAKADPGLIFDSRRCLKLIPADENSAEIVDIGKSWSWLEQVAEALKKTGRIVLRKKGGGI